MSRRKSDDHSAMFSNALEIQHRGVRFIVGDQGNEIEEWHDDAQTAFLAACAYSAEDDKPFTVDILIQSEDGARHMYGSAGAKRWRDGGGDESVFEQIEVRARVKIGTGF